jgi:hypothetical protein
MYIGSAKNNRPKFTKIVWTKDNVKTLGIHHGYNIQNDEINLIPCISLSPLIAQATGSACSM